MVATPATAGYLFHNFENLLRLGFRQIGINYALGSIWRPGQRNVFFRQLDLVLGSFGPFIRKGAIRLSNLGSRAEPAILNSEIMADTDGSVHLLTDWLFERTCRVKTERLGWVRDMKIMNEIFISKFGALYRLFSQHKSKALRRLIVNNVEMGGLAKQYFAGWKEKLQI